MIVIENLCKNFDDVKAIDHISATIREGAVFGLIGSNGAGKSTFLKMAVGVLKPDEGSITIDGEEVFENIPVKKRCFYISDDPFFFANATPNMLRDYYKMVYPNFDSETFQKLLDHFELNAHRKVHTFSKGMKKQLSIISALSAQTDYIFCDETFDGLDPVARQAVKSLLAGAMADRGLTPIIASHNLRELEDICDHVGLLHKGGILFSKDLDDMKLGIHKVQCAFSQKMKREDFSKLEILSFEERGSLYTLTARGSREEVAGKIAELSPVFSELLPLSLEEIFVSETEVRGYDIKKLIF